MNATSIVNTREKIAVAVSAAIVLASIVYWAVQISGVIETLRLAYGQEERLAVGGWRLVKIRDVGWAFSADYPLTANR